MTAETVDTFEEEAFRRRVAAMTPEQRAALRAELEEIGRDIDEMERRQAEYLAGAAERERIRVETRRIEQEAAAKIAAIEDEKRAAVLRLQQGETK